MTVFIDLQKYKDDPIKFLDVIVWKDDVESSYYLDRHARTVRTKLIPLKDAPEWVINNLYLLNLDKVKVRNFNQGQGDFTEYTNIKPIELLQKLQVKDVFINGLLHIINSDRFRPYYNDLVYILGTI